MDLPTLQTNTLPLFVYLDKFLLTYFYIVNFNKINMKKDQLYSPELIIFFLFLVGQNT